MKKNITAFLLLLLGMLLLPIQVMAHTGIDEEQEINLTIQYELSDVNFRLYQIAEFSKTGEFTPTETYAEYPIELDDLDSEGWRTAAEAYAGYIEREQMKPSATGETDENGQLVLEQLDMGIYLVLGESQITEERIKYEVMPFMLSLPSLTEQDTWDYEPVVIPKYDAEELPQLLNLEVIKLWKNDSESERPGEIVAQLLKDGEVYEEVVLHAANGWAYQWDELELEAEWKVVEKEVPSGYTVKVSKAEHTYTITNTGTQEEEKIPVLPQTGQLWWPVPVLIIAGVIFLLVGAWCRKRRI